MNDDRLIDFVSPLNQSSYIKVIGVGGGGNNAVNHMYRKGIQGVDFIVANTDMKALDGSPVPNKLVLGHEGLGVGGRPARARAAAEEKEKEIKELFIDNTKMVFITAGMGGGTGTGAAPVIARYAKEIELEEEEAGKPDRILVVAVVTTPFMFEGNGRVNQANAGVEELRKCVDAILVINNEKLRAYGNLVLSDAFSMANDVLLTAVKGISEIITLNAMVNVDFRDVKTVMENSGTALMGIGEGEGENRACQAIEQATTSVLLNDNDIAGAKHVLMYISYGPDNQITMDEMNDVTNYITQKTGGFDTNVIWGTGEDASLGSKLKITLIATGFETKETKDPERIVLVSEEPSAPRPVETVGSGEPTLKAPVQPQGTQGQGAQAGAYGGQMSGGMPPTCSSGSSAQPAGDSHVNVIMLEDPIGGYGDERPQSQPSDEGITLTTRSGAAAANTMVGGQPQAGAGVGYSPGTQTGETFGSRSAGINGTPDREASARAARIKMMHEMLRNDPDGPHKIMEMDPLKDRDRICEMVHSAHSEASRTFINADGTVRENRSILDLPD